MRVWATDVPGIQENSKWSAPDIRSCSESNVLTVAASDVLAESPLMKVSDALTDIAESFGECDAESGVPDDREKAQVLQWC